jgi:hypothetical protein
MEDKTLIRCLNTVGKTAFVSHFELFQRYAIGQITKENAVERLVNSELGNEDGSLMRLGNAKRIFVNQAEEQALSIILESNRLDDSVLQKAKRLFALIQ